MKSILALFLAVVLAVVAVVGVNRYIKQERAKATAGLQEVPVIVAKKRIKAGTIVTKSMLTTDQVAERHINAEAIMAADVGKLVGQMIRRNVERGDDLLWSYFQPPEEEDSRVLLAGERAITIPVDVTRGVAGLIRPNSRIDIYGTFSLPVAKTEGKTERKTLLLLSDVTVLAIDNMTRSREARAFGKERQKTGYSTLTVAVNPQEASLLIFAQSQGDLCMALRNHADVGALTESMDVTLENMLQIAKQLNEERAKKHVEANDMMPAIPGAGE